MSARQSPGEANQEFASEFNHYASQSKSRFNSEGVQDFSNMDSMNAFGSEDMDFTLMQGFENNMEMNQHFFDSSGGKFNMDIFQNQGMPNVDPSHVWQSPDLTPESFTPGIRTEHRPAPKSAQTSIVRNRDQVKEQFGQITPTEDALDAFSGFPSREISEFKRKFEEEDIAKQNRTQRARNAANKRHSKSKTARRDSSNGLESDGGDGEVEPGKSTNQQREKNRLAAAKCRAKKKANSEEMQESHRDGSRQNSYLHREVRELRDQKAFLRNSLLQHEPGLCKCHAIHRFNFAQAQQLALGVGAMIGQPLSPSQESMASAPTPASDGSMGPHNTASAQSDPRRMSMSSRAQSFHGGSNFNIGQINGLGTYPQANMAPDQSMAGPFTDFLHNSSDDGRPGFS